MQTIKSKLAMNEEVKIIANNRQGKVIGIWLGKDATGVQWNIEYSDNNGLICSKWCVEDDISQINK